ncbi:RsiV family protein [Stomatobaculum longum]|uniref:RsiV family protein n=1 Tax=Stomatobaculum longum TaxID=796942 RepID=UPI0028ECCC7B|nr:RsiV family protein [Stomatobaculum longum]
MKSLDIMEAISDISERWVEEAAETSDILPMREGELESAAPRKVIPVKRHRLRNVLGIAASLAIISAVLPNLNRSTAYALQSLPIAGAYFKLVTVRDYTLAEGDRTATVKLGEVQLETEKGKSAEQAQKSAEEINATIQRITEEQIAAFREELGSEGFSKLEISTEVVTDNDNWYSVSLTQLSQSADSAENRHYFTIRKRDGKLMTLRDLFAPGSDYRKAVSEEIKRQMREDMAQNPENVYWLDSDSAGNEFTEISERQSFYINREGKLVICFDEGDVAPMSMGSLQFVMPEALSGLTM